MKIDKASDQGVKIVFTRSLFGKLIFFMLLIGVIPLSIGALISYSLSQAALDQSVNNIQEIIGTDQSVYFENWVIERSQDIETLSGVARIASLDPKTAGPAIKQYYELWKVYETIFLAGPDGRSIASSDVTPLNVAERDYFKQAMSGKVSMSEALVSKATGHLILVFAAPILSKDGAVVGVIAATIPLDTISENLARSWIGETADTYLINQQGYFVTAPRFAKEMKAAGLFETRPELEAKLETTAGKQLLAGNSGQGLYSNYLGKQVYGRYIWMPEVKLGLVTETQSSEANAPTARLAMFSFVLIAVSILVISLVAYFLARQITDPVKLIANSANRLALGDLDQTLTYKSRDEYGLLADSFRSMTAYQKEMAGVAEVISNGDLTADIQPKSDYDELGRAFKRMIASLRQSVGKVAQSASALNSASAHLASAATQAGTATAQIAATVQQVAQGITQEAASISVTAESVEQMTRAIDGVARGAQDQNVSVTKAAEITSGLSRTIEQVAGNAQSVTRDSAGAAEAARLGARTVAETVNGMQRIKSKVHLSAQAVTEMGARSDQIGTIVELIEDIASQTNLLALNAAIEAARAGEHGKGFAVVADEVRKLAERSGAATKEIGGLIKAIQKTVTEAVRAMEDGGQEVENGVRLANESGEALATILKAAEAVYRQAEEAGKGAAQMSAASNQLVAAVEGVSAVVEENTAATEQMAAGTTEVTRAIENIAAVSEENSAAIEEVSASTEQMSAQMQEITVSASTLAEMALALQGVVDQFNLE